MQRVKRLPRINRQVSENKNYDSVNEIRLKLEKASQEQRRKRFNLKRNVYIGWELLGSEAFRVLNKSSIRVLLRFLQKRTWSRIGKGKKAKTVYNNDKVAFTYAEASALGIKTNAFYEAIKRLVEVGFIDIEHQGGAYGKDYSRYSFSERWRNYGTSSFVKIEKKRSLHTGMDIQSNIKKKRERQRESHVVHQKRFGALRLVRG